MHSWVYFLNPLKTDKLEKISFVIDDANLVRLKKKSELGFTSSPNMYFASALLLLSIMKLTSIGWKKVEKEEKTIMERPGYIWLDTIVYNWPQI